MKKVCEEKNLDVVKYEFRHPGGYYSSSSLSLSFDGEMCLSRQFLLLSDNKDKSNERIFICEQH